MLARPGAASASLPVRFFYLPDPAGTGGFQYRRKPLCNRGSGTLPPSLWRFFGNLLLVNFELWLHRFFQRHRFRGDNVHQRAALRAWGTRRSSVSCTALRYRLSPGIRPPRGPAEGFVGGSSNNVGVRNRVRINAGGNQARHVRHIDEQVSADAVSDFTHFRPVNDTGVSGEATDDHLRFCAPGPASPCLRSQFYRTHRYRKE